MSKACHFCISVVVIVLMYAHVKVAYHLPSQRDNVLAYLKEKPYLDELKAYINLPSITLERDEVYKCALFAKQLMENSGLVTELHNTTANPVLYGEKKGSSSKTVLLYGHYDVQPPGNLSEWNTPPFEATLIGNKLYGRGSGDNKGQHYAHLLALRYLRDKEPAVFNAINVKFVLDGDEEKGSPTMESFITENKERLKSDFVYLSDGPSTISTTASILGSARGIKGAEVTIEHNPVDLHSGNWGGVARSATRDLIALISDMVDPNGKVLIPGFYDAVLPPTPIEQAALDILDPIYDELIKQEKVEPAPLINPPEKYAFQNQKYPTMNVNGIRAGDVGEDYRTVIPKKAVASLDMRLVPKLSSQAVFELVEKFINDWATDKGIPNSVSITTESGMEPAPSSFGTEAFNLVTRACTGAFQNDPLKELSLGGSLPTFYFPEILKIPCVIVPYALPDEKNHAPNENLDIPYMENGVAATAALLSIVLQ